MERRKFQKDSIVKNENKKNIFKYILEKNNKTQFILYFFSAKLDRTTHRRQILCAFCNAAFKTAINLFEIGGGVRARIEASTLACRSLPTRHV